MKPLRRACGVDEAGRGPLAGPVYAAAVILDPARRIRGLDDSKLLAPAVRQILRRNSYAAVPLALLILLFIVNAAVQPPFHRDGGDAEHLSGLDLGHPLDPHQAKYLPLLLRQVLDRFEHAAAVRAEPGSATGGRRMRSRTGMGLLTRARWPGWAGLAG